jgi:2-polyprenyl-3-methyl-5-hydroxy-6-metoxy-1,4-benzoquinol methylase
MTEWWQGFFDADYLHLWGQGEVSGSVTAQVDGLWSLLALERGSRVLDAPCGYGRLSRPLAERGAIVLGVDQSQTLLDHAERERGDLPASQLRYVKHDLRKPLGEGGFDCALNVFSSLGYGTEEDDLAILETLRAAVRPGGLVFVETNHRDLIAAFLARSMPPCRRLPDGTLVVEDPRFDPIRGRIETTWYWSGPSGQGKKSASLRLYTATELVRLLERAGLRFESAHRGFSSERFRAEGPDLGGRLGLLAARPTD